MTCNSPLIKLFNPQLRDSLDKKDTTRWRHTQQHYSWNEMTTEITEILEGIQRKLSMNLDSILIKKCTASMAIPIHLDHTLFSSSFVAIPLFPTISSLLIYNHIHQYSFTKPVQVSPPCRFSDFLTLRISTQQPSFLLLLTQASIRQSCSCHSEYCMSTILQQPSLHQQYQTEYVDKVPSSFSSSIRLILFFLPISNTPLPNSSSPFYLSFPHSNLTVSFSLSFTNRYSS